MILYLIAKNVVVGKLAQVLLLGRLWGQNKGLHEPSHRSVVAGNPDLGP
jgi:hypothetical protein